MADLLVKLYDFKMPEEASAPKGIRIFRPMTPDRKFVTDFVRENFGRQWASECETAFFDFPVRMWVAADGKEIVGFACYEWTAGRRVRLSRKGNRQAVALALSRRLERIGLCLCRDRRRREKKLRLLL